MGLFQLPKSSIGKVWDLSSTCRNYSYQFASFSLYWYFESALDSCSSGARCEWYPFEDSFETFVAGSFQPDSFTDSHSFEWFPCTRHCIHVNVIHCRAEDESFDLLAVSSGSAYWWNEEDSAFFHPFLSKVIFIVLGLARQRQRVASVRTALVCSCGSPSWSNASAFGFESQQGSIPYVYPVA